MSTLMTTIAPIVFRTPDESDGDPDTAAAVEQTSGLSGGDWLQAGIIVAVGIAIGLLAAWLVRRFVSRYNRMIATLAGRIVGTIVFIIGFVYGLNSVGVAVGPLVGALGIGAFAVAFALRDILQNILAGVVIQLRRPFEIGHLIKLTDYLGRVQDVTLRTVVIDAVDGEQIIIPCHNVISDAIENWSANEHRRADVVIGVPYDCDLDSTLPALADAMRDVEGAIDSRDPMVLVDEFAGSSVNIRLLVWHNIEDTHFLVFRSRVAAAAKKCINDNGIEVPFPIRTLDVPSDSPLIDRSPSAAEQTG